MSSEIFCEFQDIKLALCQMIGQSATGQGHEIFNLTEKELLYKQKIGMELLEVANKISPGLLAIKCNQTPFRDFIIQESRASEA